MARSDIPDWQRMAAKRLRAEMTDAERKLWQALRAHRFRGVRFRRQAPLGPYIADFVSHALKIVVEVDGGQHSGSESDERRDAWMKCEGYRVLRFWNNDVLSNLEGVLDRIGREIATAPSPQPSPTPLSEFGGEGAASHFGDIE
jgi:very-short-patch-repair endonuclease